MIIGTPTIAIVLATGRTLGDACDMRSAPTAVAAPVRREAGSIVLCADVLKAPLAMCGATIPTKPSGPQNAVTVAARRLQLNIARYLILRIGAPDISANSSPKRSMSRPFAFFHARMMPMASTAVMMHISLHPVLEKLPADQL